MRRIFAARGYTEKEAYNLTAYALENGAYNRTASLQAPYKYGAACAFAAWTAELNGGETATLEIRSGLWTTREEGTKKTVYTLEYRAGNIGGVAQKTLALQSELFIAETSGAELLETLSPAELSAGENVSVKDLHGRGRYALTENSARLLSLRKSEDSVICGEPSFPSGGVLLPRRALRRPLCRLRRRVRKTV